MKLVLFVFALVFATTIHASVVDVLELGAVEVGPLLVEQDTIFTVLRNITFRRPQPQNFTTFDTATFTVQGNVPLLHGLAQDYNPTALARDHKRGLLYICTDNSFNTGPQGILKYKLLSVNPLRIEQVGNLTTNKPDFFRCLMEDTADGIIIYAQGAGGLSKIDGNTLDVIAHLAFPNSVSVQMPYLDVTNRMGYFGTSSDILKVDLEQMKIVQSLAFGKTFDFTNVVVFGDAKTDRLFIGGQNLIGIYKLSTLELMKTFDPIENKEASSIINMFVLDVGKNALYVGISAFLPEPGYYKSEHFGVVARVDLSTFALSNYSFPATPYAALIGQIGPNGQSYVVDSTKPGSGPYIYFNCAGQLNTGTVVRANMKDFEKLAGETHAPKMYKQLIDDNNNNNNNES